MILHIDGEINKYYVQTLLMVFFPGSIPGAGFLYLYPVQILCSLTSEYCSLYTAAFMRLCGFICV